MQSRNIEIRKVTFNKFEFVVLFFTGSLLLIIFKGVVYQPYIYNELPKIPYWFLNGTESINAIIFAGTTFIMIKKIKIKTQIVK